MPRTIYIEQGHSRCFIQYVVLCVQPTCNNNWFCYCEFVFDFRTWLKISFCSGQRYIITQPWGSSQTLWMLCHLGYWTGEAKNEKAVTTENKYKERKNHWHWQGKCGTKKERKWEPTIQGFYNIASTKLIFGNWICKKWWSPVGKISDKKDDDWNVFHLLLSFVLFLYNVSGLELDIFFTWACYMNDIWPMNKRSGQCGIKNTFMYVYRPLFSKLSIS